MKRFKSYINESVELDESITKMSDARLKFHVLKNVPHGSYTKKELSAEHDRRKKTGGVVYNAVKPSLNEENIDEAVNAKKIAADHDAGHSIDVIVQKHLNKKGDNKDEILKAIQAHRWNKRMKKEEVEQIDELKKSTLGSYVKKAALSRGHAGIAAGASTPKSQDQKDALKTMKNRITGVIRATDRLTKEEVELDEARKSDSYQFTHKPGDAESEKRLADLKKSVKGTGKRVVLQGRLGKDNPNAHKYSKDAPSAKYKDGKRVNSDVSGKSGGHSHQRIQKADAAHHDVYVYDRNESVELDELKKSTLGSYIKKANVDAMKHAQKSGEYNNPDQPKHFSKAMDRMRGVKKATDKLTKEEVEQIDEISKATLRKVGGQMLRKGLSDDPKADKHMKYANLASAKLYPNQYKNSPLKAKVNATEEVESLDELSKKTLGSYVKKAAGDAVTKAYRAGDVRDKDSGKNYMKALGRQIGISTATSKLAKEEVEELDELSKKTLGSYVKKASRNLAGREYKRGAEKDTSTSNLQKSYKRDMGIAKAVDKLTKEEVENLDELKKSTLGSYVKKAAGSMAGKTAVAAAQASSSMGKTSPDIKRGIVNRMKGITRATDRLTKEEVELDEVSDKKLDAYRQKAFADQPAGDDGSDKYRKRKFGRDLAFSKQTGRAKVLATKEEADLEEKLVGGQKKLDHNKNGKIDAHDFHLMRNKKMKEEVEGLDEISRDLARRYIRKIADKTNTGELSVKQVEKRRPGLNLAGKKAYPSISGEPKVRATD
jgi:lipid-binding SYLF domain-containing protein